MRGIFSRLGLWGGAGRAVQFTDFYGFRSEMTGEADFNISLISVL